jgi:hypothetical protein
MASPILAGPISGTAFTHAAVEAGFNLSGPGFEASSETGDWHSGPEFNCTAHLNDFCNFSVFIPTSDSFAGFFFGSSQGTLNGVTANALSGGLLFSGSVFVPAGYLGALSAPVTVGGTITGNQVDVVGGVIVSSTSLWSVNFLGTGTMTVATLVPGVLANPSFSFVEVPEPAAFILMSGGLLLCFKARPKS